MNIFNSWIEASRPRTLPLSISGILVGSACAYQDQFWSNSLFALAITTTLLFQILSNLANDLGDTLKGADTEDRVGPTRSVQSGAISVKSMKKAVIIVSVFAFVSAGLLIYQSIELISTNTVIFYLFLAVFCILAAITYTIGKKAYGYSGFGDVFVFIFFGLVSVLGVYPLFTNTLPLYLLLPAITIGLLSTAVLNLNNLRDHENDQVVGKKTLVVKMGFEKAKIYHYLLITIAFVCWVIFLFHTNNWIAWFSILPFLFLVKHLVFIYKTTVAKDIDSQLKIVALCTFAISLIFSICTILTK